MKFRVYDVITNETILIFEAENPIKASYIVGKMYGENDNTVDVEEYK